MASLLFLGNALWYKKLFFLDVVAIFLSDFLYAVNDRIVSGRSTLKKTAMNIAGRIPKG